MEIVRSPLRSSHWKYIDDVTISEVTSLGEASSLQSNIDCISQWALQNNMNINPKKCKVMTICPLKSIPDIPTLIVNNLPLDSVSSYEVLGLTLSDTLKWNDNTTEIISKASKRRCILRVLKRAGDLPTDLIAIYNVLVHSVLEYSCVVWATGLPRFLIDQLEAIQVRALRILYPALNNKPTGPYADQYYRSGGKTRKAASQRMAQHQGQPELAAAPPSPSCAFRVSLIPTKE